ncbi:MAG: hypothetical protein AB1547_03550 [Thermodesulfobacteriota bacterium]
MAIVIQPFVDFFRIIVDDGPATSQEASVESRCDRGTFFAVAKNGALTSGSEIGIQHFPTGYEPIVYSEIP